MPSPYRAEQLSPEIQARYGMDRSNWRTAGLVILVIVLFFGAVAFVTVNLGRESVQARLISWTVVAADHVSLEIEVMNPAKEPAFCIIRAQDEKHIDLAYSQQMIPPADGFVRIPIELRTLAPAFTVELLGCESGHPPQVSESNFPPGVAAPEQPWQP
jgi:hypothetical protein